MNNIITTAEEYFHKYINDFDPHRRPTYVIIQYKNDKNEIIESKVPVHMIMGDELILSSLNQFTTIDNFIGFIDTPPFSE